jgi:hypothetical protein
LRIGNAKKQQERAKSQTFSLNLLRSAAEPQADIVSQLSLSTVLLGIWKERGQKM